MTEDTKEFLFSACVRFPLDFQCIFVVVLIIIIIIIIIIMYVCSAMVDAKCLHDLLRKRSAPRQIRHAQINDIIWRSVKKAQYLAVKESVGLSRSDGKRSDGAIMIP